MPSDDSKLAYEEIESRLGELDGWSYESGAIVRSVDRGGFPAAVALLVRIGFEAEAANHHPDVDLRYSTLRISLTSHDKGGVTARDLEMAGRIDRLVAGGR